MNSVPNGSPDPGWSENTHRVAKTSDAEGTWQALPSAVGGAIGWLTGEPKLRNGWGRRAGTLLVDLFVGAKPVGFR